MLFALTGMALLASGVAEPQLSGEDFLHGQAQLEQLLLDRPALGEVLIEGDPLRIWTAARFAGAGSGFRIHWDQEPPPEGVEAQHALRPRPLIRVHPLQQSGVARGRPKSAQDLWADLIFELHNIARADQFVAAWQQVRKGRLDHAGWLEAVTRTEHRSLLDTRAFYRTRWRVWMRRRGSEHLGTRWRQILAVPTDYAKWLRRYDDPLGYPYADYGRAYQQVLDELAPSGADWQVNPFKYRMIQPR